MTLPTARRASAADNGPSTAESAWLIQARRFAPRVRGRTTESVALERGQLLLGRHPDCDVLLADPAVAPCHAVLERQGGAVLLRRATGGGTVWVNGQPVESAGLIPGDRIHLGPYTFVFEGDALACVAYPRALTLAAVRLGQNVGRVTQLQSVTLLIQPGEFVGILGPSGAGKTTLLEALSGVRPARSGTVLLNGEPLAQRGDALRRLIGYVPQEDILHRELTTRQAWRYAAQLRLPRDVPAAEREQLVEEMLRALDLAGRADIRIDRLSGGQRKRANVGAELLGRPGILFLDEPTAGLDHGIERRLMRTLRDLTRRRQTVVCTTHVVESVDLFDKVAILAPGGALVYFGPTERARRYFGVERFTELYERLEGRPVAEWQEQFAQSSAYAALHNQLAGMQTPHPVWRWSDARHRGPSGLRQGAMLLGRFCRILGTDRRNLALLLAQPLAIAGLICLVYHDLPRILFLLVIASLWFACSTAAQQIVKERPVFRRERMLHLSLLAYALSKFLPLAVLAVAQSTLMLLVVWLFRGGGGNAWGEFLGLALAACGATALGLIVSALAGNADKATAAVPLVMLPQIILAGVLVALPDLSAPMRAASTLILARWANGTMEAALLHGREVDTGLLADDSLYRPLWNRYPEYGWATPEGRQHFLADRAGTRLDQSATLHGHSLMLAAFVLSQLGVLVVLLQREQPA